MSDRSDPEEFEEWPVWRRGLVAVGAVALGPLWLGGELVGPGGHVHWRQIVFGVIGTLLWGVLIFEVVLA